MRTVVVMSAYNYFLLFILLIGGGCLNQKDSMNTNEAVVDNGDMVWIPGDKSNLKNDHPLRNGFWIDEHEVTNRSYNKFVEETGYITVAERKINWEDLKDQLPEGTPRPHDSVLVPGSIVFIPPTEAVTLNDYTQWWKFIAKADWKHPEGERSSIEDRWDHPVVHIAYEDALAYCEWAGKRLPTEAEWELAAANEDDASEVNPEGKFIANTYQGSFPIKNLGQDGFVGTSPVKTYTSNKFGLYDMVGNVWEWTSDGFYDAQEPGIKKRITKGGSYLCASNYCSNYRSGARQATAEDSGISNVGFRCVRDKQ